MERLASKTSVQNVEAVLQETLARLKETRKMEGEAAKSPQRKEEVEHIMEPSPQPSLGSYYNFFGGWKNHSTEIHSAAFLCTRGRNSEDPHMDENSQV